jgi:hypothetical protein
MRRSLGLEDAELVSLWILKDGPRLAVLFHVPEADPAELNQTLNLGVAIGDCHVQVDPILDNLLFRHNLEQEPWSSSGRVRNRTVPLFVVLDVVAEGRRPETDELRRTLAINDYIVDSTRHDRRIPMQGNPIPSLVSTLQVVDAPREIGWTGKSMGIQAVHVFQFEPMRRYAGLLCRIISRSHPERP